MAELRYGRFAPVYDLLGRIWTAGQIRASKLSQIDDIQAGDKVLYAGSGTGEDALAAARKGAHVVIVELEPQMLRITRQRFEASKLTAEFICGDMFQHLHPAGYDVVVANFFLNVFIPERMEQMGLHLIGQLRPGGKLMIADFAPLRGGLLSRLGARIHHGLPLVAFAVTVNQPIHPIYDYRPLLAKGGLQIQSIRYFGFWGRWSEWILSITAVR